MEDRLWQAASGKFGSQRSWTMHRHVNFGCEAEVSIKQILRDHIYDKSFCYTECKQSSFLFLSLIAFSAVPSRNNGRSSSTHLEESFHSLGKVVLAEGINHADAGTYDKKI